jgi:hypothetical protein
LQKIDLALSKECWYSYAGIISELNVQFGMNILLNSKKGKVAPAHAMKA